jgi:hypothetical protein
VVTIQELTDTGIVAAAGVLGLGLGLGLVLGAAVARWLRAQAKDET